MRGYAETRHRAKSWDRQRRAIARIEATWLGLDIRFVVTNLDHGSPEWLYDSVYCARGQAENLIKLHKTQLLPIAHPAKIPSHRVGIQRFDATIAAAASALKRQSA